MVCTIWSFGSFANILGLIEPGSVDTKLSEGRQRAPRLVDTRVGVDPPAFAVVCSRFTDDFLNGFQTAGADDFTVPDCGWEITTIRAFGNYSDPISTGSTGPATSVNVYIIPKTGSLPASTDMASIALFVGEEMAFTELDPVNGGDFEIAMPHVILPQGDYWLVVQANIELFAVGQWNWTESSLTPNSGTTFGDESIWFQGPFPGVASPISGNPECVGAWNTRVTGCQMTRNPDSNPPADRDFVFQVEGNVLSPGVTVSESNLVTIEDGSTVSYSVVLDAPPTPGATVTITPGSSDVTEGTVSGALQFTGANWDIPQLVTITPGSTGDGNDGDVGYSISHVVSSTAGAGSCYEGVAANSISVTNQNIEGIASILVAPSSGLMVSEDGTVTANFTVSAVGTPTSDVSVPLTIDTPGEVTLSSASAVLNAGNGFAASIVVTGVSDQVVEPSMPFSITTEPSSSSQPEFNGVNPVDITGSVTDNNVAEVLVQPAQSPLQTSEAGGTDFIDYVLTAQPTADVSFQLSSDDPAEASVSPSTVTFTSANWDTPQTVQVTGLDDDVDDETQDYLITSTPTSSSDGFWQGVLVASVAGQNADDGDTAGVQVVPVSGLLTNESGTTDTFSVVLTSQPVFFVTVTATSDDSTEGLLSASGGSPFSASTTIEFTISNWNVPQTITVQGQDDAVEADGDVTYQVQLTVASGDASYGGNFSSSVEVTNQDDEGPVSIQVTPLELFLDEDGAPQTVEVRLATEPTSDVTFPVSSTDPTEAIVTPGVLVFTPSNWNTPQAVTVTPQEDLIIDDDRTLQIELGPATGGGNYDGQEASVEVTVHNVDFCGPMTLDVEIGNPIIACGTPTCIFDLYNGCADGGPEFLGTFELSPDGCVDTGIFAEPNACYYTTVSGETTVLTEAPAVTVPTLGVWGLIALLATMTMVSLFVMRKHSRA